MAMAGESSTAAVKTIRLKVVVTVQKPIGTGVVLSYAPEAEAKSLRLELVSENTDPEKCDPGLELVSENTGPEKSDLDLEETGLKKETIECTRQTDEDANYSTYLAEFKIPEDFGSIGAVVVENEHHKEIFVKSVVIEGIAGGPIRASCNSWVQPGIQVKRVFFLDKVSCLPSKTPNGLKSIRNKELKNIRGDGVSVGTVHPREKKDRIYDYDLYNDLGDPDKHPDLARSVLGGTKDFPYPRRCKTGRPPTKEDTSSESRSDYVYIPRDEVFSEIKNTISFKTTFSVLRKLFSAPPQTNAIDKDSEFSDFTAIESLFTVGDDLPPFDNKESPEKILPRLLKPTKNLLRFELPETFRRDKFGWTRDEEFCRQTIAGVNPLSIRLVEKSEWPLKSKLDEKDYGPAESAITEKIVEEQIGDKVEKALEDKKLFMLDYHDIFLPYVNKVRNIENFKTTLYGSRTLMYLTPTGTLKPVAIELVRPKDKEGDIPQWKQVFTPTGTLKPATIEFVRPKDKEGDIPQGKQVFTPTGTLKPEAIELVRPKDKEGDIPQGKQVFTPGMDSTGTWLWKLAKVHVLAHDSCYHQLVSHWLRTHCCTEPYIIATNRQLSKMHPIHNLLHPHFRYTMEINALARQALINSGGIIESCFSPGKYSMELSSVAYREWRFDHEALPADLIARGMAVAVEDENSVEDKKAVAVEDKNSRHGLKLKLHIEDYPYANDGLDLWYSIEEWVTEYVNHYYPEENLVVDDTELQAWWGEIKTKGHEDKKDEPWWPVLKTQKDLIGILTTIIWVASGHHAAVNFGQYDYAGYIPNRGSIARVKMPCEDPTDENWKAFEAKPEDELLSTFPSKMQALQVMAALDSLSNHSPDEEYIGDLEKMEPVFEANPDIKAAYKKFAENLKKLESDIDARNADKDMKNRNGVGVIPYKLLKPFSDSGVTGMGVPNSISI